MKEELKSLNSLIKSDVIEDKKWIKIWSYWLNVSFHCENLYLSVFFNVCIKEWKEWKNGILLPKLFWPTVRKNCSSNREKLLKFEAGGREFAKILRSLEKFIQTVKGQNNFW